MKIVIDPVKIGRHHRSIIGAILSIVRFTQLYSRNFGQGIRLIGRLKHTGEQRILTHRLGHILGINTGTAKKQQPFHPAAVGRIDHVGFDHHVDVNKLGRISIIGMDTTHPGRGKDHIVRLLLGKKTLNHCLVGEVQLLMGPGDHLAKPTRRQLSCNGRTDQPAMTSDIYLVMQFH